MSFDARQVSAPAVFHQRSSSFTPSPLGKENEGHKATPDVTFDQFLVRHKSGKGEAFRGADNAMNEENGKKKRMSLKRLSLPILKVRT